jgi:hypothetical protein
MRARSGMAMSGTVLAFVVAAAMAPAAASATPPAAQVSAGGSGEVGIRLLPARAPVALPLEILDNGVVVGQDVTLPDVTYRPWVWRPGRGRQDLGVGEHASGQVLDASLTGSIVGSTFGYTADGNYLSTPVRWDAAGRAVPLLTGDEYANGQAVSTNLRGDALVNTGIYVQGDPNPLQQAVRLVSRSGAVTPVEVGPTPAGIGVNTRRQVTASTADYGDGNPMPRIQYWLWRRGTNTELPSPGLPGNSCYSRPTESGWIVGYYSTPPVEVGPYVSVLIAPDGTRREVPGTPALTRPPLDCTAPGGINERGHVVLAHTTATNRLQPAIWRDGVVEDIPLPPGARDATARALNERDDVVVNATFDASEDGTGSYGVTFVRRAGRWIPLPLPAGYWTSYGIDITNDGRVLGVVTARPGTDGYGHRRAVVWTLPRHPGRS